MSQPGPAGEIGEQEENAQVVEAGTSTLGIVQGCLQAMQRWSQEGQGPTGTGLGKGYKEEQGKIHYITL